MPQGLRRGRKRVKRRKVYKGGCFRVPEHVFPDWPAALGPFEGPQGSVA